MSSLRLLSLYLVLVTFSFPLYAQPGKNGPYVVTSANQVLNKYSPVSANIGLGTSTVAVANPVMLSLCPGDLIMVYQAQGASMNVGDSVLYGNITSYGSAGLYEFKYVQSVNGNTITCQNTFTNAYFTSGRVQVIKIPQYTTLTINPGTSIVAKNWKDTTISAVAYRFGGLVVIHATTILNNGTISASA